MASDFSFKFSGLKLDAGLKSLDPKINRALFATAKFWDGKIEAHMKQKAPWKDRTSNARNGLFANAARLSKGVYAIILGHSVTYGIFLELGTRFMRKRPIIVPTMQEFGPKVMQTCSKLLDRLK